MKNQGFPRIYRKPTRSFFLFGPRGVGKTTWLQSVLPEALWIDLLAHRDYLELSGNPSILADRAGHLKDGDWVVIDEVQKVPAVLDEVHRIMQSRDIHFAISGSSARKLKREGANLLGGRALTLRMEALSAREVGEHFALEPTLQLGSLPLVVRNGENAIALLEAYIETYLREEIRQEGLVRKFAPFVRFLSIAGMLNAQTVNLLNVSREAGVSRNAVEGYFSILIDTLIGHWLPAYRPGVKVRESAGPKFYWFDPGVARAAAGLLHEPMDRLWRGTALETWFFHELRVYNQSSGKKRGLYFYRTLDGAEADFVVELAPKRHGRPAEVALLEVKSSDSWNPVWEKTIRRLSEVPGLTVKKAFGVYLGTVRYTRAGIEVMPAGVFLEELYGGRVF